MCQNKEEAQTKIDRLIAAIEAMTAALARTGRDQQTLVLAESPVEQLRL